MPATLGCLLGIDYKQADWLRDYADDVQMVRDTDLSARLDLGLQK